MAKFVLDSGLDEQCSELFEDSELLTELSVLLAPDNTEQYDPGAEKEQIDVEKSVECAVLAIQQEELTKAAMQILTKDKKVLPGHNYSHSDGPEDSPRFYYKDPNGNVVRYTNAPSGHPDGSGYFGDAEIHPSEPQFELNPEYFSPEGKKLTRAPETPESVEWNMTYNPFDANNMWAGRWAHPETGEISYTYIDADLRNFPHLRVHQQNVQTDVQLPFLRESINQMFNSDRLKDQITAIALLLLDQGRMRATELCALTPANVQINGNLIQLGSKQIYADSTVKTAIEILCKRKAPDEPLLSIPLQNIEGEIDETLSRRIGPRYLSAVLDNLGISLLGLQTYHASLAFSKALTQFIVEYGAPWEQAFNQALLIASLEWGHDFSQEIDAARVMQLVQSVLIDPILISVLQQKAQENPPEVPQQPFPPVAIPVPYVSFELVSLTADEKEFSQFLHNVPLHNYI